MLRVSTIFLAIQFKFNPTLIQKVRFSNISVALYCKLTNVRINYCSTIYQVKISKSKTVSLRCMQLCFNTVCTMILPTWYAIRHEYLSNELTVPQVL